MREAEPSRVAVGQSICAFTPYITYLFGELTMDSPTAPAPGGRLPADQLILSTAFVLGVVADMLWQNEVVLRAWLETDLRAITATG